MKITYPGYGRFFFELYPFWMRICAFAAAAVFSIAMFAFCIGEYEINCQYKTYGEAKNCSLHYEVLNIYSSSTPLGQLLGAELKYELGRKNTTYHYLVLNTNTQSVKPTEMRFAFFSNMPETVQAINNYVQSSLASKLELHFLHNYIKYFMIFFGILFGYIALYALLLTRNITIDFNKTRRSLLVRQGNAFSCKKANFYLADGDKISVDGKEYRFWEKVLFTVMAYAEKNEPAPPSQFNTFVAEQNNKRCHYRLIVAQKNGGMYSITDYFTNEFGEIRKISQLMNSVISC